MQVITRFLYAVINSRAGEWLIPIGIVILFLVLIKPLRALIFKIVKTIMKRQPEEFERLRGAFIHPVTLGVLAVGVYLALRFAPGVHLNPELWVTVVRVFRSLFILFVTWVVCILEGVDGPVMGPLINRLGLQMNSVLFPFVSKILRFITVAIAALIIVQEWDFSVSGLLAGLGLGGLAFALAAQDMLSNLFGGAVILIDRPFAIGDWILSGDVEGTVEDINFRSVKIRTFTLAVVTVPNAMLASSAVTNFSRMGKRRVLFNLTMDFDTTQQQMKICTERILALLRLQEDIDQDTVVTVFDSIGDCSLNLMVVYYTKSTSWLDFIEVRGRMYYEIMEILKQEKAELAFPTQTVYLKQ
ncbi:MAG: mechanosensitive ion channel family protein [Acetanaerobacterium sp.]